VDDCSSDRTRVVVESVARQSPIPIRFFHLPKNSGGPSRPLNVGIEAAKGEIIVILEQDDLMRPSRIEKQLKAVLEHPECSLATGHFAVVGNDEGDMRPLWPVPQFHDLRAYIDQRSDVSVVASQIVFLALLNRNFGTNSSFCFSKAWWTKIGGFNETVNSCADFDFILRAAEVGPIVIVNEMIFDYRWRRDSLYRRRVARSTLEVMMVRLRAASRKQDWAGETLPAIRYSALMLAGSCLKLGDATAISALLEILARHRGFEAIRRSLQNRARLAGDSLGKWMNRKD
jgi:succinoglycan biosynthesis protein ExoO